eukprot:13986508-Alexandrium_andersonii.AAC.1
MAARASAAEHERSRREAGQAPAQPGTRPAGASAARARAGGHQHGQRELRRLRQPRLFPQQICPRELYLFMPADSGGLRPWR